MAAAKNKLCKRSLFFAMERSGITWQFLLSFVAVSSSSIFLYITQLPYIIYYNIFIVPISCFLLSLSSRAPLYVTFTFKFDSLHPGFS